MEGVLVEYINSDNVSVLTRYNYYWILWCPSDSCEIFINRNRVQLNPNQFYLLPPHNTAYFDGLLSSFQMKCIGFSAESMTIDGRDHFIELFRLFYKTDKYNALTANESALSQMNSLFVCLENERHNNKPSSQIVQSFLRSSLLILTRLDNLPMNFPDINAQRVGKFFLLVKQNARFHKKVDFYAKNLNISSKRLNQILHLYTSWNVTEAIQQVLMHEAISLLINGMHSINQISDYLGFTDRSYFSKAFKRNTGLSPENYLLEIKQKEAN